MSDAKAEHVSKTRLDRYGRRFVFVGTVSSVVISLAILLPASGRLDYQGAWLYAGTYFFVSLVSFAVLIPLRPELLNQRGRPFREGTASFDFRFFVAWRILTIISLLVAGLEARFHPHAVPELLTWVGVGVAIVFGMLATWPLLVNPHFEVSVRVQEDRNHKVISTGPYAIVRHPGYAFFMPVLFVTPLILESWWSSIPTLGIVLAFLLRTASEDRFLRRELEGYSEYASKVRFRIFPRIW